VDPLRFVPPRRFFPSVSCLFFTCRLLIIPATFSTASKVPHCDFLAILFSFVAVSALPFLGPSLPKWSYLFPAFQSLDRHRFDSRPARSCRFLVDFFTCRFSPPGHSVKVHVFFAAISRFSNITVSSIFVIPFSPVWPRFSFFPFRPRHTPMIDWPRATVVCHKRTARFPPRPPLDTQTWIVFFAARRGRVLLFFVDGLFMMLWASGMHSGNAAFLGRDVSCSFIPARRDLFRLPRCPFSFSKRRSCPRMALRKRYVWTVVFLLFPQNWRRLGLISSRAYSPSPFPFPLPCRVESRDWHLVLVPHTIEPFLRSPVRSPFRDAALDVRH